MEPAHGPTMPPIARVCHIQTPPWPTVIEAPCGRICRRVAPPDRRRCEAPTARPLPSEWGIGVFRKMRRPRAVTFSAAFEMAARRGCTAITDIRASGPPAAAAEVSRATVVVAAVTAADAVSRKGTMTKTNFEKNLGQQAARLLGAGLLLGTVLLAATLKDGQRTFATPQEAVQAIIDAADHNDTAALLQLFGPRARTSSTPAIPPKTRTFAPNLRVPLTKSSGLTQTPSRPIG